MSGQLRQIIYQYEKEHRERMEAAGYPTPAKTDNVVWTGEEFFEHLDEGYMRTGRYRRNNDRPLDPGMELGDAIKMAATGLLTCDDAVDDCMFSDKDRQLIRMILIDLADLLDGNGASKWERWDLLLADLITFAEHQGYDPYAEYVRSCKKIERKHGGMNE